MTELEKFAAFLDPSIWALPEALTTNRRATSLEKAKSILTYVKDASEYFEGDGAEIADVEEWREGPHLVGKALHNAHKVFGEMIDAFEHHHTIEIKKREQPA